MGPPGDWFTKIEYIIFRVFVLSTFIIAVVKIVARECRGWPNVFRASKPRQNQVQASTREDLLHSQLDRQTIPATERTGSAEPSRTRKKGF